MALDLSRQETRVAEIAARTNEIQALLDGFDTPDDDGETRTLEGDDAEQYAALIAEGSALAEERTKLDADMEARRRIAKAAANPEKVETLVEVKADPGDPYDLTTVRMFGGASELKSRALKAIETTDEWEMEDRAKERATQVVERHDNAQGHIAALVLSTGSKRYKEAWAKAITGRDFMLSTEERNLLGAAMEVRAMSQTTTAGGFAIPFPIDPTLIITGDGSSNPFRRISRVEPILTDTWQGISAGAISASWDAEAAEVSDDTPTWAQPSVTPYMARMFVPASIEITQDYPGIVRDLGLLFQQGKDDHEATAFATGTGTAQPFGIVTAIDGTGNDTSSATTDVFAVADVRATFNAVGTKYRGNVSWVANNTILNEIVAFGTSSLGTQTLSLADDLARLVILGHQAYESSAMDGTYGSGENNVLVAGDFSNYLIADRVGFAVEYIPHMFATANNLPSGQRGWFAYWRVGADSVNDDAFALLNVT